MGVGNNRLGSRLSNGKNNGVSHPRKNIRDSINNESKKKQNNNAPKSSENAEVYTYNPPGEKTEPKTKFGKKIKKIRNDKEEKPVEVVYENSIKNPTITDDELRQEAERYKEEQEQKDKSTLKRWKIGSRVIAGVLIGACSYLIFLIFGVIMTTYTYTDSGEVVAEVYSIDDVRQKRSFDAIIGYYDMCRDLYEEILIIDYQLSSAAEDYPTLGGRYTALLDTTENLYAQIEGANVESQYNLVIEMMSNWLVNGVKVYLENIATYCGSSGTNTEAGNNAITYNSEVYNYFSQITANIITMGDGIKGIDLGDIRQWSPESFISEEIDGVTN